MKKIDISKFLFILLIGLSSNLFAQCPSSVSVPSPGFLTLNYFPDLAPATPSVSHSGGAYTFLSSTPFAITYSLNSGSDFSLAGTLVIGGMSCSYDAFGNNAAPLPIELVSFTGQLVGDEIELNWSTSSEENNAGFSIERSYDGNTFAAISAQSGAGNSSDMNYYSFTDRNAKTTALGNLVYYRLKQTDRDGSSTYTSVISIDLEITYEAFQIISSIGWNTPGDVQIYYHASGNYRVIATVTDINGRIITRKNLEPIKGMNQLHLDFSGNKKGMYFVTLTNGKKVLSLKQLIQNL